jgi:NAD(P)-dependent dehydrogenase (short-subunit alcohol dehydrogenase family)
MTALTERLAGKSAVVTGAAAGIGKATAIEFARQGARLVITDVNAAGLEAVRAELAAGGAAVAAVTGDVSIDADARAMIRAAVDAYGRLDVLVANAGIIVLGDLLETTPQDWDRIMSIDGRGMFLTCKYAVEAMLKTGGGAGGAIICLSSISGMAGQKRQAAYGPAKFVASGLAMHLGVEWAKHGIRVNAVAPGTIRTERVKQLPDEPGGAEYIRAIEQMHPMGRLGEPEEVAKAIAFLASDDASFITGVVLPVDGGYLAQ